jgi:DNA repair protein RadA/Sms
MAKRHSQFVCSNCGRVHAQWMGKCPDCGEWDSLTEKTVQDVTADKHRLPVAVEEAELLVALDQVKADSTARYVTGISEFDRVLGGGIVPGSAVLIGGDPGIGKSTLLLQVGHALAVSGRKTIYVSSEESLGQIRLRADRLGLTAEKVASGQSSVVSEKRQNVETSKRQNDGDARASRENRKRTDRSEQTVTFESGPLPIPARRDGSDQAGSNQLLVSAVSSLDIIANLIDKHRPAVVVIDSIQMVYRADGASPPGSASQLRDCAARLIWLAKQLGFALLLVGHVTKEGAIAGPKILEHLVDCVAYFEGDRFHVHRLIRAIKNRYGSTDELGIFEIGDSGLRPIVDPSRIFLQEGREARPGSVVLAACEGARTLLVEVQALCAQSVFGAAKRKATGVDAGRVAMILAVIEKHAECVLGDQDVFVNVVGGVRVQEPAADLAIALAVLSAMTRRTLDSKTVVCGELGLGGELRAVHHQRQRIAEAARIGFKQFILPAGVSREPPPKKDGAITLSQCQSLGHAAKHLV